VEARLTVELVPSSQPPSNSSTRFHPGSCRSVMAARCRETSWREPSVRRCSLSPTGREWRHTVESV